MKKPISMTTADQNDFQTRALALDIANHIEAFLMKDKHMVLQCRYGHIIKPKEKGAPRERCPCGAWAYWTSVPGEYGVPLLYWCPLSDSVVDKYHISDCEATHHKIILG